MSIEAIKQARSVISSINAGKQHALTKNGETVFWQREEWVRWALDEVLPLIDQAIAEAEKQEPYGYVWTSLKDGMETRFSRMRPSNFYSPMNVIAVYTHPQPKREPLTIEQLREHWQVAKVLDMTDAEIDFADYVLIVGDVEALYGINGEA
jgi:hypothetical protein